MRKTWFKEPVINYGEGEAFTPTKGIKAMTKGFRYDMFGVVLTREPF